MSELWFKAIDSIYGDPIQEVDIESYTEHMVKLPDGRKAKRVTGYESYFPIWDQARDHLLSLIEGRLTQLRLRTEHQKDHEGKIKGLKRPPHPQHLHGGSFPEGQK